MKLTSFVAAIALGACANAFGQSAATSETELPRLVTACNGAADSTKRRAMRACDTLAKEGRVAVGLGVLGYTSTLVRSAKRLVRIGR